MSTLEVTHFCGSCKRSVPESERVEHVKVCPSFRPARTPRPESESAPSSLSEEQRQIVKAFFAEHVDGGYTAACQAAGIARVTRAEARNLILSDGEIRDERFKAMGVGEAKALMVLGEILADSEHKDRLRAATFLVNALHGWAESSRSEHTGADGGPVEVADSHVADALDRFTSEVRRLGERAQSDRAVRDPAGGRAALPAGEVRG